MKIKKLRILAVGALALAALVLVFLRYGLSWMLPLGWAVAAVLLVVAVIDFDTREIPDKWVLALVPLAVAAVWAQPEVNLLSRGIGFLAVSLPMLGLAVLINGAFGGGDIKLMAVCGFLLGWQRVLLAFFIAVLLAGCWIGYLFARGRAKRGQHIAFGPALCAGVFAALLYGNEIISWYVGWLMFYA
ncbi:MAG: A24 family peptidase [Defluviitaleaceae bacterium]|nr:A24 family peptidase [Defluviitaleaceae bacterium]MCL2239070.1 A24 family peptidase [Defluviitaleaceae bacterium]